MHEYEVLVLRNAQGMLSVLIHAPRVPFIALRQLGAVESNPGRQFCPILAQPTVEDLEPLAHRTLSGAHRTVRCPHPTVGSATRHARIARPTVGAPDRWLTEQSGEL
jgi:hypothetical protein